MANVEDSAIETCLRNVACEASRKDEAITVKLARSRVESELKLESGFLKNSERWKNRSKEIVTAAFNEEGAEAEQPKEPGKVGNKKQKDDVPKPQKDNRKDEKKGASDSAGNGKSAPPTPKRPETTAPKVNGVKRKAQDSASVSEGAKQKSTLPGEESSTQQASKKTKLDSAQRKEDSSSSSAGSSSASEEDSSSGSESSKSDAEKRQGQTAAVEPTATAPASKDTIQAIPAKAYKPPPRYTALDSSLVKHNDVISAANLQGKQVWHITAPSSIPLSSLADLVIPTNNQDKPILTHNNVAYTIGEDHNANVGATELLLPSAQGYQASQHKVSRTLHLWQHVSLPELDTRQASQVTGSAAAADIAQPAVSTARPQPKGLRMRFKPPGFGKGELGTIGSGSESDGEEATESQPTFQFPKALGQFGTEARQDGDVEMVDSAEVAAPTAEKKKRKEKNGEHAGTNGVEVNGLTVQHEPSATPGKGAMLTNGDAEAKESKEDKKRRKEEKRARKEAKAKAKS